MPTENIPEASEIRTPPYSGHTVAVSMVSALEGFHCSHKHNENGEVTFDTQLLGEALFNVLSL